MVDCFLDREEEYGEMEKVLKAIKPIGKSDYRAQKSCFTCGNNATK